LTPGVLGKKLSLLPLVSVGMRAIKRIAAVVLMLLVFLGVLLVAAQAKTDHAVVLHPKWRLVAQGPTYVAANDRYVLIVSNADSASPAVRLLDEETGVQQTPSPPNCPSPDYSWRLETGGRPGGPIFGGPWLMVTCGTKSYELYNLASGQWVSFVASPQCGYDPRLGQGACVAVGVGSSWVKLFTTDGSCIEHCGVTYYLQNIQTGEFKPDPATVGGAIFDDLNAPSGSSPLCSPLRYPKSLNGGTGAWEPGSLTFYGQVALASADVPQGGGITAYRLKRCRSRLNLAIDTNPYYPGLSPGIFAPPVASSRAVIWTRTSDGALVGRFLPGLQRFTIRVPAGWRSRRSQPPHGVTPVALTQRTIFVTTFPSNQLWAAALPPSGRRP
jgi:hypothetical protein